MAKKPAAPPDPAAVDALVTNVLLTLATADGPRRLVGKGDHLALFAGKTGANKAALDLCQAGPDPLVAAEGSAKAETVRLTEAGFSRVLPYLPDERVGPLARQLAATLPTAARLAFIRGVVSRTRAAAPELLPLLQETEAALEAETQARLVAVTARREREQAEEAAIEQILAALRRVGASRLAALRREYEAEGGRAADLPAVAPRPEPGPATRDPLAPQTPEEHGFRREVVRRLAAAWREAVELGRDEPARFLEAGIGNVRGVRQVGEAGETVRFDGEAHEADEGVSTGAPVRVLRPGWAIDEDDDRRFVILKAKVAR